MVIPWFEQRTTPGVQPQSQGIWNYVPQTPLPSGHCYE